MNSFTLWEILLDYFELNHEMACPEYLSMNHPIEKLIEDYTYEFMDCPGLARDEYWALSDHFKKHSDAVLKLAKADTFSESQAVELLANFEFSERFKSREVELSQTQSRREPKEKFELWRQDDNGNEFLISSHPDHCEARLLRKRLERRGHKQHYWVRKVVLRDQTQVS